MAGALKIYAGGQWVTAGYAGGVAGPQGPQGEAGSSVQGPQGAQGAQGAQTVGAQGTQGTQGPQGAGVQGAQGAQGPQGGTVAHTHAVSYTTSNTGDTQAFDSTLQELGGTRKYFQTAAGWEQAELSDDSHYHTYGKADSPTGWTP